MWGIVVGDGDTDEDGRKRARVALKEFPSRSEYQQRSYSRKSHDNKIPWQRYERTMTATSV